LLAVAPADLARVLLPRETPCDRARAGHALREALAIIDELGMRASASGAAALPGETAAVYSQS
jgi:hypothetical protein